MFSEFLDMFVLDAIENTCGDSAVRYKQSKRNRRLFGER